MAMQVTLGTLFPVAWKVLSFSSLLSPWASHLNSNILIFFAWSYHFINFHVQQHRSAQICTRQWQNAQPTRSRAKGLLNLPTGARGPAAWKCTGVLWLNAWEPGTAMASDKVMSTAFQRPSFFSQINCLSLFLTESICKVDNRPPRAEKPLQ